MNLDQFCNWVWFVAISLALAAMLTKFSGCHNIDMRDPASGTHIPPYVNGSQHP